MPCYCCPASAAVSAQEPQYKANVPASVTTPDKVRTELLGDLDFFDGMPSKDTVKKAYDFLDTARGAEAFLNGIPAASIYAVLEGIKEAGVNVGDLGIFEELMDARSLYLTPNSTTIYNMFELNVKDGPIVVEVPTGVLDPLTTPISATSRTSVSPVRTRARAANTCSCTATTRVSFLKTDISW